MLFYCPLEAYKERYTAQWSAPKTGWLERNWIKHNIPYRRIDGRFLDESVQSPPNTIQTGSVVDAVGRSCFCFNQIEELLSLAQVGSLTSNDTILFDDFWTPGFEALPYAFHLLGIKPKMYAFLHAQSVDEYDFTYPMRRWMRDFERGIGQALDGIFVCCPTLKELVVDGCIAPRAKVHITGHPFSSEEVMERMPDWYRSFIKDEFVSYLAYARLAIRPAECRSNQVVWSSRWDREKDPMFFLSVAKGVIEQNPESHFVLCTSAPTLRSNDPKLLQAARDFAADFPDHFQILEGLTKEDYYHILAKSKIQFNCALQDFVAITLLESSVAGCYPVYPHFRSFPETFLWRTEFMYQQGNIQSAVSRILYLLGVDDLWTADKIQERSWIHSRFDTSWIRMLWHMNLWPGQGCAPGIERIPDDPFNPTLW